MAWGLSGQALASQCKCGAPETWMPYEEINLPTQVKADLHLVVAVGCTQLCRSQRFYQSSLVCKCFDKTDKSLIRDSCKQNMQRLQTHRSRFLVTSVSEPKFKLTNGR